MIVLGLDQKIRRRSAGAGDLGADAGVGRLERAVGQVRPIGPDRGVEGIGASRIDVVSDRLDPLDVRPEPRLTGEVEREMDAQAPGRRHGIDEPGKRRADAEGKVVAPGQMQRRDLLGRHALDRAGDGLRAEAGRVDDEPGFERHRLGPAALDRDAGAGRSAGDDGRLEREHRAMRLGVAQQGEHEGVAVDDAGRRGQKRALGCERRLERPRLLSGEPNEVADAVGLALGLERGELFRLGFARRDDQLAATPVRDAVVAAECVQQGLALDAQPCFYQPSRVVDAGVDDLAVARACSRADGVLRLDDDHLPAFEGQRAGDGKADDAGADDETV